MAQFWQLVFRESPSFGEGFVVRLTALPHEDVCRYELRRGSSWELELGTRLPLAASGEVPRAEADAMYEALLREAIAAVPPDALGILDGVSYSLNIDTGGNGAMYCWKCDLPQSWRALQPAIDYLKRLVPGQDHPQR